MASSGTFARLIGWGNGGELRKPHRLVTTGPYARVRHPLYTAMLGVGVAFAPVTANWVFVLFGVLCIVGTLVRVPREERMMLDEFGSEYAAYMQRTGRFLPPVTRCGERDRSRKLGKEESRHDRDHRAR